MPNSINYSFSPISKTPLKTYSRTEDSMLVQLIRVKDIKITETQANVFIEPLGLTSLEIFHKAKEIFLNQEFAALYQVQDKKGTYNVLQVFPRNFSKINPEVDKDKKNNFNKKDIFLIDNTGICDPARVAKITGTDFFSGEEQQEIRRFVGSWCKTVAAHHNSVKAS
ncbi:MAG: hypothetical protein AAGG81_05985 [Chlamydiota bacterium]